MSRIARSVITVSGVSFSLPSAAISPDARHGERLRPSCTNFKRFVIVDAEEAARSEDVVLPQAVPRHLLGVVLVAEGRPHQQELGPG